MKSEVPIFVLMVKAVCGSSRPETGSRFARDLHGLEGGKIPRGIYLSLQKLDLPYSTVHGIIRYKLKAKFYSQKRLHGGGVSGSQVGRISHVKKNEKEAEAFKENLSNHLYESLPKTEAFPRIKMKADSV